MTEVKICGLTNRDDLMAAQEYGADYVGFVLYAGSPRGIRGIDLCRILDRAEIISRPVGVFVNTPLDEMQKIVSDCNLHAVQLHGDECPDDYAGLDTLTWRAIKMDDGICVPALDAWTVDRYVLDATVPGEYGGTGHTVDWDEAAVVANENDIMLAGGLTHENVAAAIAKVNPAGVDTASGVEREPGRKDLEKMKKFIEAVKNAVKA